MDQTKKVIAEVFDEIADGIINGSFGKRVKIGLTTFGSEHGISEMSKAAELAKSKYGDFDIVLIGPKTEGNFDTVEVADAEEGHKKMLELLDNKVIDGCVTQHFDFPIGVSTVGKVVTPGLGKEMILATTTGTTATHRVEGMIKNTINGIAVAKTCGIKDPKVGILNVDGARGVERALKKLQSRGYKFTFSESLRADGGSVMRGNDLLAGTPDVMVCDSLTGNLLIKIFASFTTGGNYETTGYGYGPGVGEGYDKVINIVSRASGAPLICEALKYCALSAKNNLVQLADIEYKNANAAGLKEIVGKILEKDKGAVTEEEVEIPPKKVVTYAIPGIDILELENACKTLWKEGIYSESGMGCTGPVVLVSEEESKNAVDLLVKKGFK
ncbi:glycine/sarcosine/betaine reductase complex component C subunit alpha [Clostridium sp. MT-14]|mgnify:CR=1 FL=1|uniref:Glycine reductase n=1 Tax=Clostridium aromativorans TaxID=2836848 RepID=A0ABS8N9P5_9CLOT|nr:MULTISPECIES: glycine/sarcosine/betaine reductase complex component C subunit alpha [Clostridium]KAA8677531.1 glycine reductase [Clostridium sp. HV4-5-A1G]MCC9295775.1 glycine reductase [Clostridium aromativorans]CAB1246475.1 Glycine/sarcosine/betaine reductase complex component C subunit alpha [Clostridiaceae bacterium BL-3]